MVGRLVDYVGSVLFICIFINEIHLMISASTRQRLRKCLGDREGEVIDHRQKTRTWREADEEQWFGTSMVFRRKGIKVRLKVGTLDRSMHGMHIRH